MGAPSEATNGNAVEVASQLDVENGHPEPCKKASEEATEAIVDQRDAECHDYADIELLNRDYILQPLQQLVQTPFFRYFKVDLQSDCQMWSTVAKGDLAMDDDEVPDPWAEAEERVAASSEEWAVVAGEDPEAEQHMLHVPTWSGFNNPWTPDEPEQGNYQYVDLVANGERHTGYEGTRARRVWEHIYAQECFTDLHAPDGPLENRIFWRLISGMHASVSAHIARDYLLDKKTNKRGANLEEFKKRLGNPDKKARVQNLYFTFLFVLRAFGRAAPLLAELDYNTGTPEKDELCRRLMREMADNPALAEFKGLPLAESQLWRSGDGPQRKARLQECFRNIISALDCVTCNKCKLWGKLQMLGIATALKIVFDATIESDCDDTNRGLPQLVLERNEVIALINMLRQLSLSVETVRTLAPQCVEAGAIGLLVKDSFCDFLSTMQSDPHAARKDIDKV